MARSGRLIPSLVPRPFFWEEKEEERKEEPHAPPPRRGMERMFGPEEVDERKGRGRRLRLRHRRPLFRKETG